MRLFIVILIPTILCQDSKRIIDGSAQLVHPHPGVRPTEKPQLHEPGVPPNIPTIRTTTNKPLANNFLGLFHWKAKRDVNSTQLDEIIVEPTLNNLSFFTSNNSFFAAGNASSNQEMAPNKGVFDWVLNLVGLNNSNGNAIDNNNQSPTLEEIRLCPKCKCGVALKSTRIVGGIETKVNGYPWMAYLNYNGRFYCGASVINNKFLITAAHCVNGFSKDRLQATFLDHDRSTTFETKTFTRRISAIYRHKNYNKGGSYNNDIALLRLENDLDFDGLLRPVCLPTVGKSFTGLVGTAVGWGATEESGQVANKLREVDVPIMSNIDCRRTGYADKITDNMLCAGYKQGKKDSCQGDSGGPLHVVNNSLYSIVGIVSWGEGCAEANYPGVYTRVNRFSTWIKSNTKDACYCTT